MRDKLERVARDFIKMDCDVDESLTEFFNEDYTIVDMHGDGILGYTEHSDYYFMYYLYTDNSFSNCRIVYNTVNKLMSVKPILYTGVINHFRNNSVELENKLWRVIWAEEIQ